MAVYSFKNNTTSMGNGSGGLAPLETPKAEEGFSTGEKWIVGVLITVFVLMVIATYYSNWLISRYEYCDEQEKEGMRIAADNEGARADALVEMMDQARAIEQWCPNIGSATHQQIQNHIQYEYDRVYQGYIDDDNTYWEMTDPNYRNRYPVQISANRAVPLYVYQNAKEWWYWSPRIGGLSLVSLVGMFLNRYTR